MTVSAVRLGGQVGLEVAACEGEFLPTGEGKLRNGWYKFTLGRVPCLHQRLRLVFSNSAGAEERLELLEPIPASTEPQLAQSSFSLTMQSEMFDALICCSFSLLKFSRRCCLRRPWRAASSSFHLLHDLHFTHVNLTLVSWRSWNCWNC